MTLFIRNAEQGDSQSCMELLQSLASFTGGSTDPLAPKIFEQLLGNTRGEVFVAEAVLNACGRPRETELI